MTIEPRTCLFLSNQTINKQDHNQHRIDPNLKDRVRASKDTSQKYSIGEFTGSSTEDDAVEKRATSKTISTVNSSTDLTSSVQALDDLSLLIEALSLSIDGKTTNTVVKSRSRNTDI